MNLRLLFNTFLMVLLLVTVGCGRKITSTVTAKVSDSVHVREVPRFIYVNTPGDTVKIETLIECDSATNKPKPFSIGKKSERAALMLKVNDAGVLTATGISDSLQQVIKAMDKEIFRLKTERTEKNCGECVYTLEGIDHFCRWFTGVALLIGVGCIFYFVNKKL